MCISLYKPQKVKKLKLNSQLLTVQILTNDVQVIILCLSYLITAVMSCQQLKINPNLNFDQ